MTRPLWISQGTVKLDGIEYHIEEVRSSETFDQGCKVVELALVPVDYEDEESDEI
jgi:hypothetical protein